VIATTSLTNTGYDKALIFLTPNGRKPETIDLNSEIPVYCMSYEQLIKPLKMVKNQANEPGLHFINQFISHVEGYMSGSNEIRKLCWQLFNKHEDAYSQMVNSYSYCLDRKVRSIFCDMRNKLEYDPMFSQWSGSILIEESYKEDNKRVLECDLDLRLKHWPEGVWIKIYKHNWFGVFPYVAESDLSSVEPHCNKLLTDPKEKVKAWDDKYYISNNRNLDIERMVLRAGNEISKEHINIALNKVVDHIVEINAALK